MITQISPEVTELSLRSFGSKVYLIQLENQNILIDTSSKENREELIQELKELSLVPEDITTMILSHAHWDHIENIDSFPNAKIYSHAKNPLFTERGKTEIDWKRIQPIENQPIKEFKIHKTPGHTEGDILIQYKNILFSGDVIFNNGYVGRTDLPEGDSKKQKESLEFIKTLDYEILCPGH